MEAALPQVAGKSFATLYHYFCLACEYAHGDELRFHAAINELVRRQSGDKQVVVRAVAAPVLDIDALTRIALLLMEDQGEQDERAD